ncbi:MAG: NAD(P)H-dependent oxidoreductase subunit E [Bdellovibrionales bacterium]|nr:NAD(P)H-dependent oxidoreductase subunit E [Bdellovibrionales bacterium]
MFKLSDEGVAFVKKELERYETRRSAIIPSLFRTQKENGGWVSPECVSYLSQLMDIPEAQINEVLFFYTMFNTKPVGKKHVQVCCNISCAMNGGRELTDELLKEFGVKEGEVSADGQVTISRVECLGSCGTAPMMQVNETYHENLTVDKAKQIIKTMDH